MSLTYIGIDQSYSGFALSAYAPSIKDVSHDYLWKYPSEKFGSGVDRLNKIATDIQLTLNQLRNRGLEPVHVCIEGYAAERKFGREQSGELGATVKLALQAALPYPVGYPTIVPPKSLKKFVTGSGTAAKDNMLLGVYKKWHQEFRDNNQADAYSLARLAEAIHTGDTQFAYEREVIAKLTPHTERFPQAA